MARNGRTVDCVEGGQRLESTLAGSDVESDSDNDSGTGERRGVGRRCCHARRKRCIVRVLDAVQPSYLMLLRMAADWTTQLARKRRRAPTLSRLDMISCHELPPGMPLSNLQAAQRRLAISLVLLPGATNVASAAAQLDMDVLALIGTAVTDHCTLSPQKHSLCCQAMQTLSRGWGRYARTYPLPERAAILEQRIVEFQKNHAEANCLRRLARELRVAAEEGGGTGVSVALSEDGDMLRWEACMAGPPGSPYAGGLFFLDIELPASYPFNPPKIRFTTPMYHCNIRSDGYITADSLDGGHWSPATTIWKALLSIQSLLSDPNPESNCCASVGRSELGRLCSNDRAQYDEKAREWTKRTAVIMPRVYRTI